MCLIIILFIIVLMFLIFYYFKNKTINKYVEDINKPFINKNIEIKNLIFNVKDLYIYNEQSFKDIETNIEDFLSLVENIKINKNFYDEYYTNLVIYKQNINELIYSLYLTLPNNKNIHNRIKNYNKSLIEILDNYILQLSNNFKLKLKDINIFTKPFIDTKIKPYNVV